ncbi:MAG: retroviral-like aspartic protease family protein [Nitrososphaerales archaeon]
MSSPQIADIPYDPALTPPALRLDVIVLHPIHSTSVSSIAKIDTGADGSVIPQDIASSLNLMPAGKRKCMDYNRNVTYKINYYVDIKIGNFPTFRGLNVVTSARDDVLIGRDILNKLKLLADGRNLIFSLS